SAVNVRCPESACTRSVANETRQLRLYDGRRAAVQGARGADRPRRQTLQGAQVHRLSNPFTDQAGVATYDRARPYFHSRIATRLADLLPKSARGVALDVACGTGQSTVALQAVVDRVVGLDASRSMLRQRRSPDT